MPIAQILLPPDLAPNAADCDQVIRLWAKNAEVTTANMSVFFTPTLAQTGGSLSVLGLLYLPTLWRPQQVDLLQCGLASALADTCDVPLEQIQVITTLVPSGQTAVGGQSETWQAP